jgi:hypothetical protein
MESSPQRADEGSGSPIQLRQNDDWTVSVPQSAGRMQGSEEVRRCRKAPLGV